MKPTEHEMTIAVDAAARHVWSTIAVLDIQGMPFEDVPPLAQNKLREDVLQVVIAALEALPDRAAAERIRIGTYLTENMWCHHDGCDMEQDPCSCGLDTLLEELQDPTTTEGD